MEEEIARCWLYKDGEAQLFEGDEIAKAEKAGWADNPDGKKKRTRKKAADEEE